MNGRPALRHGRYVPTRLRDLSIQPERTVARAGAGRRFDAPFAKAYNLENNEDSRRPDAD